MVYGIMSTWSQGGMGSKMAVSGYDPADITKGYRYTGNTLMTTIWCWLDGFGKEDL